MNRQVLSRVINASKYHRNYLSLKAPSSQSLRVMTYNLLADVHAEPYMFPKCSKEEINQNSRFCLIHKEIECMSPDILCVQELEEIESESFSKAGLLRNFSKVYFAKPIAEQPKPRVEGSAIFFSKEKFSLVGSHCLNFKMTKDVYQKTDIFSKEMVKSCVASVAVLEPKDISFSNQNSSNRIRVISTHLPFSVNQGHLKFAILVLIFRSIEALKLKYGFDDVLLCGDFNLVPHSMLYEYLVSQSLDLGVDIRDFSNQIFVRNILQSEGAERSVVEGDRRIKGLYSHQGRHQSDEFYKILSGVYPVFHDQGAVTFTPPHEVDLRRLEEIQKSLELLSQSTAFKSSYAEVKNEIIKKDLEDKKLFSFSHDPSKFHNEAIYTHFANKMLLAVDYIFFNRNGRLKPTGILDVPDFSWMMSKERSLPFAPFGSDHISLVADFEVKIKHK